MSFLFSLFVPSIVCSLIEAMKKILDDRTGLVVGYGPLARGFVCRQLSPQPFDLFISAIERMEFLFNHPQHTGAGVRICGLQPDKLADFVQSETEALGSLNEGDAINRL